MNETNGCLRAKQGDLVEGKDNHSEGVMREKIKLVSSAGTGHYYTTDKNKKNTPDKMEVKKYDPVVRKHVLYKEGKIK